MSHAEPIAARPRRNWFLRNHRRVVSILAIMAAIGCSVPVVVMTLWALTSRIPGWEGWQSLPVAALAVLVELFMLYLYATARTQDERKTFFMGMLIGVGLAFLLNELEHTMEFAERNTDTWTPATWVQLAVQFAVSALPNVVQWIIIHYAGKVFESAEVAPATTQDRKNRKTKEVAKPEVAQVPAPRPKPADAPQNPAPAPEKPAETPAPQNPTQNPAPNPAPQNELAGRAEKRAAAKRELAKIIDSLPKPELSGKALKARFAGEPFNRSERSWDDVRDEILGERAKGAQQTIDNMAASSN